MSKPGNLSRMPRQASSSHSATDFSSQSVIPSATVTVGNAGKRSQSSSICQLKWTLVRRHCSLAIPQWRYGARNDAQGVSSCILGLTLSISIRGWKCSRRIAGGSVNPGEKPDKDQRLLIAEEHRNHERIGLRILVVN